MRKSYELKQAKLSKLHSAVEELNLNGFCGVSMDGEEIHIEFNRESELSKSEKKKLDALIENYVDKLDLSDIRKLRQPLLDEADWRFNRAVDDNNEQLVLEIKEYRKKLRDITLQEPNSAQWPNKPWDKLEVVADVLEPVIVEQVVEHPVYEPVAQPVEPEVFEEVIVQQQVEEVLAPIVEPEVIEEVVPAEEEELPVPELEVSPAAEELSVQEPEVVQEVVQTEEELPAPEPEKTGAETEQEQ